jgi:hypothetical protein
MFGVATDRFLAEFALTLAHLLVVAATMTAKK